MAYPTIQTADTKSGTQASNSNSWTLTYPTNLQSGDLILALVATDGSTTGTWPAGWVKTEDGPAAVTLLIAKKLSNGTETGNFTLSLSASEQGAWRVFRITGWHGTLGTSWINDSSSGDVERIASTTGSPSTTPDPPSNNPVNWDSEQTLWFAAAAVDTSRAISGYPSNCPDNRTADVSGGSTGATLGIATANVTASSFDPNTFSIGTSDDWCSATIAIRPAAGGATQTLSPSGIGSSEAFGTPAIATTIALSPSGIGTGEAFGSPMLTPGTATVSPSGIAGGEAFGTPSLEKKYVLTAETGVFTLTGNPGLANRMMRAIRGAYFLTGRNATFPNRLQAQRGQFMVSGPWPTLEEKVTMPTGFTGIEPALFVNGKLFVGTWDIPAHFARFNSPATDLTDYDQISFPSDGRHSAVTSFAYSSQTGKLYVCFMAGAAVNGIIVDEIDPDTLEYTEIINDTSLQGYARALLVHGDYLYVTQSSFANVRISRWLLSDYSFVDDIYILGAPPGHSLIDDGTWIYATGDKGFCKVAPDFSSYTVQKYDPDQSVASNTNAVAAGRVWLSYETQGGIYTAGSVNAYLISDLTDRIRLEPILGVDAGNLRYSLGYVWVCYVVRSGNAETGNRIIAKIDPNNAHYALVTLPSGLGEPNGILEYDGKLYGIGYTDPAWVARLDLPATKFLRDYVLTAETGEFIETGNDAELLAPAITIEPSGIGSEEAFGSPTITPGAVTVSPSGIGTGEAFGSPTVVRGAVTVSPSGVATQEAFGTPTVTPGAVTVSPSGIGSEEALGTPTVEVAGITLSPSGIETAEAFGSPTLTPGTATVAPSAIAGEEAFGTPSIGGLATVSPSAIDGAEAFGTPSISTSISLSPSGIPTGEAFGAVTVTGGAGAFPQVETADTKNGTQGSNSNNWTLTYPTNLQAGNLILAAVATDGTPTATWPSGWIQGRIATSANTLIVAKKISDGTETGNFSLGLSASEQGNWRIFRITGWHGTIGTTFDNTANSGDVVRDAGVTGLSGAPDPGSLDPNNWATESTLWFAMLGVDANRSVTSWPLADLNTGDLGGASGSTLGICSAKNVVASLDPSAYAISASDDWAVFTVAIRPGVPATVISPSAIAGAESFGTATITPGTATVSPSGIGTGEAFGIPTLVPAAVTISPSGIGTGEAFGSPTIAATITLSPTGIGTAEGFGTATVTPGTVAVAPAGIGSAEAFGTAALGGLVTLLPAGIGSEEAFGTPSLAVGIITISPTGIGSGEAHGTPTITPGAATVAPTGIVSGEAFGTPTLAIGVIAVSPSGIASGEAFGTPTINPGAVTISPSGIASTEAFGTPSISATVALLPAGIGSGEAFGTPEIVPGMATIAPAGIASGEAFGSPRLAAGSQLVPTGIPSGEAFGTPTLSTAVELAVTGIASAEAFGVPAVGSSITLAVTGIASGEALGTPAVAGSSQIVPIGIISMETFGTPALALGLAPAPTRTYTTYLARQVELQTSLTQRIEFTVPITRTDEDDLDMGGG